MPYDSSAQRQPIEIDPRNEALTEELIPRGTTPSTVSKMTRHTPFEAIQTIARQGIDVLGDAYMTGSWTTPHLDQTMAAIFSESPLAGPPLPLSNRLARHGRVLRYLVTAGLCNLQQGAGSLEVAHRHYDLGNDLFEAMLDRSMTYTSGVWRGAKTLEEAQRAKLDALCKKMDLQPGMSVLDIGCGWGNFAEYAAREYGVLVTGITISTEQARYARERCAGLTVTILEQDYRHVQGTFDRVVSIEMIEAVGKKNLGVFFDTIHRSLKPNGLLALQAISAETVTRYSSRRLDEFLLWILRHIFPNGYLPTLPELMTPARSAFVLESLDNLGDSYEKTLLAWEKHFVEQWSTLSHRYDEQFFRMWRFYLLSCAALFRIRMTHVYQIVYRRAPQR